MLMVRVKINSIFAIFFIHIKLVKEIPIFVNEETRHANSVTKFTITLSTLTVLTILDKNL